MYRSKKEIIQFRDSQRTEGGRSNWFKKQGYNATLRVESSPSGLLAHRIKKRIREDPDLAAMKILVSEKSGIQIGRVGNFSHPEGPAWCSRPDCFVCLSSEKPTNGACWREGTSYRIECLICQKDGLRSVYFGESGYSGYYRGRFHIQGLKDRKQDSVLYEHELALHPAGRDL